MKRAMRTVKALRIVATVLFFAQILLLYMRQEVSMPSILVSAGVYVIFMEGTHLWVMRGLPKIQGRMMLTENGVLNNKKPPNRFWYWLLRDFVEEQRSRETSDEET